MEEEILEIIRELLDMGYEIRLSKNSIKITEIFKSVSRDNYTEKDVFDCFGSLNYFEKGILRITKEKLLTTLEKLKN